ncbi:uncharacterized protein LOC122862365 [Siniperca chuatsi]|uniref:uncharacterized protein LOC122862365 n=1 Tax=Siniperca chuatsi TaxID=119488 RepID=UPI001CE18308|nr:uncharacterized protein LOC122862365 [Siniperca chuatsi]
MCEHPMFPTHKRYSHRCHLGPAADGEPHDCVAVITETCSPGPDLQETPLINPELELFVDGTASQDPATGKNLAGFAVTTLYETILAKPLPSNYSAQAVLVALTEACKCANDQTVNIFTDSRYAWGVAHDFGKLWANKNFLTSTGNPIAHHTLVAELLDAVLLPKQIAICKCEVHTNNLDPISQGNARADKAAKAAPKQTPTTQCVALTNEPLTPTADLQGLQTRATAEEKAVWRKAGCTITDKVWYGPSDRPCLPKYLFHYYVVLTHGRDHGSKSSMVLERSRCWFAKGINNFSQKCNFAKNADGFH